MGDIPLYMGEFNSGFTPGRPLTQKQFSEYVKRFKKFRTCGWALWRWSYNLSKITEMTGIFQHLTLVKLQRIE